MVLHFLNPAHCAASPPPLAQLCPRTNLFGNSGEFHNVESLVIGGGALVNVDNHGCFSFAAENCLEELGELALSERNVAALHSDAHHRRIKGL